MRLTSLFAGALVALLALPALAQNQEGTPTRIRGKIESLSGDTLTVKSRDGADVKLALTKDTHIFGLIKAKLADIKKGDFIGSAAVPGKDGKLHAEEVVVFPEFARGMAEGHYPWDLKGGEETMTNATVSEVTNVSKNRVMTVQYKGGEKEIAVAPGTPIVSFDKADKAVLKKGKAVFVPALKKPDGSIVALAVLAEQNGVKPPM